MIIYFHGNAEDIGLSFDLLSAFGQEMRMHVLVVEYPGYGLYRTTETSEHIILEDADIVYDYLTTICGVQHQDIILFGRSIGTGPTSYLISRKPCHSALLMSAYTSIKDVAKNFLGWVGFMNWIVAERFPNLEHIKSAKCPCFFMHGVLDNLIPYQHSAQLKESCPQVSELHLVSEMDHNNFQLMTDLVVPFKGFLTRLNYPTVTELQLQQASNKLDNIAKLLGNRTQSLAVSQEVKKQILQNKTTKQVSYPSDSQTYKYFISKQEDFNVHCNVFDYSCVEYYFQGEVKGDFDIFFDEKLYEAPEIIVRLEAKLKHQQ